MLRRGLIRFEYIHLAEHKGPAIQVVFQFGGTERGVLSVTFVAEFLKISLNVLHLPPSFLQDHLDMKQIFHQATGKVRNEAE